LIAGARRDVGRDGVGAEDQEGAEKAGWLEVGGALLRRSTIRRQSGEQQQAEAAGEENVGTGPELLVRGRENFQII